MQNRATLGRPPGSQDQPKLLAPRMSPSAAYWALNKAVPFNTIWNTTSYILDQGPLARLVQSIAWAPGDDGSDWRLLCRMEQTEKAGPFASPFIVKLPNDNEYTMVFVRSSKNYVQLDCRPLEMPNLVIRTQQIIDGSVGAGKASSGTASEPSYSYGTSSSPQSILH